jgi:hypothetical protein
MSNSPEPIPPKVFISYAWKNQPVARQLELDLQRDGAQVFVDYEEITGGDSLPGRISAALDWCNTLILLWSADSAESYWVAQEWESAFQLQKRIIPCLLDGTALPALLRGRLYLNLSPYETGYAQLCRSLGIKPNAGSSGAPLPEKSESPAKRFFETTLPKWKRKKPPAENAILIPKEEARVESPPPAWWRRSKVTNIAFAIIVAAVVMTVYQLCFHASSESEKKEPASGVLHLRDQPMELAVDNVKSMLRRYDFYCGEHGWTKEWSNPEGKGIDNDYVLQQDGKVVFDRKTGLMWQQSGSPNYMTYADAEKYIRDLNNQRFAGYSNWRLPTLEEVMSLMEPRKHGDLYIGPKFDSKQSWIWTSDTYSGGWTWCVNFYYGDCHLDVFDVNYMRAVRS